MDGDVVFIGVGYVWGTMPAKKHDCVTIVEVEGRGIVRTERCVGRVGQRGDGEVVEGVAGRTDEEDGCAGGGGPNEAGGGERVEGVRREFDVYVLCSLGHGVAGYVWFVAGWFCGRHGERRFGDSVPRVVLGLAMLGFVLKMDQSILFGFEVLVAELYCVRLHPARSVILRSMRKTGLEASYRCIGIRT